MNTDELRALTRTKQRDWIMMRRPRTLCKGLDEGENDFTITLDDGSIVLVRRDFERSNSGKTTVRRFVCTGKDGYAIVWTITSGPGWHGGYGGCILRFETPAPKRENLRAGEKETRKDYTQQKSEEDDLSDAELKAKGYKYRATPSGCQKL